MDRRKYLKTLAVSSLSAAVLLQACDTDGKKKVASKAGKLTGMDRTPREQELEEKLHAEQFFNAHEMATLAVLADIIIPADEVSGSATDAGVPEFIEFIVKDRPEHQVPMRGGLRWLDLQCLHRFGNSFVDCTPAQHIQIVDQIAFPGKAEPQMRQGVVFFNLMRDLTATGFFTSEIGIRDLGYMGNTPNRWDGVPEDVLGQYKLKYDQRTLNISVKFDDATA